MDDRFEFPLRKSLEIAASLQGFLRDEKISVTKEDVTKPVPEKLQAIIRAIISVVYDRQCLYVIPFQEDRYQFENGNDVSAASLLTNTTCFARRLLHRIGIKDFIVADLVQPQTKRTVQVLSGFTNFMCFRQGRMHLFESASYKRDSHAHELQRLNEDNVRLQQRLASMQKEAEERAVVTQQLHGLLAHRSAAIKTTKSGILELENKVFKMKMDMAMTRTTLEEVNTKILSTKEECGQLKQKIFPSREHFLKELAELTDEARRLQEEKSAKSQIIRDLDAHQDYLRGLDKSLDENFALLGKLESQVADLRQQKELTKNNRANLEALRQRIQDTVRHEASLAARALDVSDNMQQFQLQHARKIVAVEAAIKEFQRQREDALSGDFDNEYHLLLQEQRGLHVDLAAENQRHQLCLARISSTFDELLEALDVHHNALEDAAITAVKAMEALRLVVIRTTL